jgi:hypothetical protein
VQEGKDIIAKLSALKHEMGRNGVLTWVSSLSIPVRASEDS